MNKLKKMMILCTGIVILSTGCKQEEIAQTMDAEVYYTDAEQTRLETRGVNWEAKDKEKQIEFLIEELQNAPGSLVSVFEDGVSLEQYELDQYTLKLFFDENYNAMDKEQEVLFRAAVVQTMTQVDAVNNVMFFVNDEPLTSGDGDEIGAMRSGDFTQSTGASLHAYEEKNVTLYYADSNSSYLIPNKTTIRYNSNITIEKAIVEQLIHGNGGGDGIMVIPVDTALLGVTVKDKICYVNVDDEFAMALQGVPAELTLYTIVNSIIDSTSCEQVQISINGESKIMFHDTFDLSKPLKRNDDIVRGELSDIQ